MRKLICVLTAVLSGALPGADAIPLTYWGSILRELPAEESTWSANLPANEILRARGQ